MIQRKIDNYLADFYAKHKNALLVTGARQIGKTSSIREFGRTHFKRFVEINFLESPSAKSVFEGADSSNILLRLSAYAETKLVKGETLIFLDEIQECPDAVTAIKFLVEDGSYRYILSGSLLGVELKDIRSLPVGFLTIKEMYPLDFEEFARAVGVQAEVLDSVRAAFENKVEVDSVIHEKMMEIFRLYLVVGGMPAAVAEYLESNNIQNILEIQQGIIELYKKDIAKYDPENKLYLNEIFDLIPPELNNQNKRFILKKLNENIKFSRHENSFIWLKEAGVALPVYNVDEPKIPLLLSRSRNLFKLFLNDVGLLTCQYANGIQLKILNGENAINFGSVYENVAAMELRAHGFDLYYFNSKKQGELDFVIERNGRVLPIEIKSGKDYKRHNALKNALETVNYDIHEAVVFCNDNLCVKEKVLYCPIYMLMFLENEKINLGTYKVDLHELVKHTHHIKSKRKNKSGAKESSNTSLRGRSEPATSEAWWWQSKEGLN